jgi:hypothetical protein
LRLKIGLLFQIEVSYFNEPLELFIDATEENRKLYLSTKLINAAEISISFRRAGTILRYNNHIRQLQKTRELYRAKQLNNDI